MHRVVSCHAVVFGVVCRYVVWCGVVCLDVALSGKMARGQERKISSHKVAISEGTQGDKRSH